MLSTTLRVQHTWQDRRRQTFPVLITTPQGIDMKIRIASQQTIEVPGRNGACCGACCAALGA